jgi:hypothetical protein
MKAITELLAAMAGPRAERLAAQKSFLQQREKLWHEIQSGEFPATYVSTGNRKYSGAPLRTAIRCDFLLANELALGSRYAKDRISDAAQRDLLFYVLRDREVFPERTGKKFYCCPKCTSKLYECVCAKVFRYIDNAKWRAEIEGKP